MKNWRTERIETLTAMKKTAARKVKVIKLGSITSNTFRLSASDFPEISPFSVTSDF